MRSGLRPEFGPRSEGPSRDEQQPRLRRPQRLRHFHCGVIAVHQSAKRDDEHPNPRLRRGRMFLSLLVSLRSGCLFQVASQAAAVRGVAKLAQGLGLDLADALAGDAELAADFLEGPVLAIAEAEAELDDLALAVRKLAQRLRDLLL